MSSETPDVLTEQEREGIGERVCWHCHDRDVWSEVERIVAARVAAERERADAAPPFDTENLIAFVRTFETGEAAARALPIYFRAALGGEATP